jgi:hypothetical protein
MIGQVLIIILLTFPVLFSCQSISEETYRQAADETCSCVEHLKSQSQNNSKPQNDGLRYALCTMEIEKKFKLDVQDAAFEKALKNYCPEMYKVHENVVNNALQLQSQTPK